MDSIWYPASAAGGSSRPDGRAAGLPPMSRRSRGPRNRSGPKTSSSADLVRGADDDVLTSRGARAGEPELVALAVASLFLPTFAAGGALGRALVSRFVPSGFASVRMSSCWPG
ncbi:hypothetical protein GCM10023192_22520 [Amycolatopsis samaneae]